MTSGLVVVSAGTYHLPFDRLSDWVQQWMGTRPEARVVMQHGPSRPVPGADNRTILPYDELLELCRSADAVVLQGGAGGVMDMRALGVIPVVVPRVPGSGEVVDDHQLVFTAEMAGLGLIRRATSYDDFAELLDASLAGALPASVADIATPGVAAVRDLLDSDRLARIRLRTIFGRGARTVATIARDRFRRLRRGAR